MRKNKKDKENCLINQSLDAIVVKILAILQMNAKMRVREETMNLTTEESNLFMAYTDDILLQGVQEMKIQDNLWYLDTGASLHMIGMRSYFQSIDENQRGLIRFGNESLIAFEGK